VKFCKAKFGIVLYRGESLKVNKMDEKEKVENKQEVYKAELERLFCENDGELTPEKVVNSAKKVSSPLHDYFVWEDSDAAKMWRLHQARLLFGYVKIDLPNLRNEPARTVRIALQVINDNKESVYVPTLDAVKIKSYAKQLVDEIIAEMETLNNKMLLFRQNIK
jgi:hypothetical protein